MTSATNCHHQNPQPIDTLFFRKTSQSGMSCLIQYSRDPNKFTSELIKTVNFLTSELFEIQRHIAKNSSFHPTGELIWYKDI